MAINIGVRSVQPYKYIGKELDRMFGWNMLDHGARWYDAAAIRWWNMDMLAEKDRYISPYIQSHDNPVAKFDLNGKTDYYFNEGGCLYKAHNLNNCIEQVKVFFGGEGNPDRLIKESDEGNVLSLPHGTIQNLKQEKDGVSFEVKDGAAANEIYNKLIENSTVEWASVKHGDGKNNSYTIVTNRGHEDVNKVVSFMRRYEKKGERVLYVLHNHPKLKKDTEANLNVVSPPSIYDMKTAGGHPETIFFIYNQLNNLIQYYDEKGVYKTDSLVFTH